MRRERKTGCGLEWCSGRSLFCTDKFGTNVRICLYFFCILCYNRRIRSNVKCRGGRLEDRYRPEEKTEGMIKSLHLLNYRCFKDTTIRFKDVSAIVGKNNAGKSSLIEALRMAAMSVRKCTHTTYKDLPKEFGLPVRERGFRLEVEKLKIDLRGVVYRYEDVNAQIQVLFENNVKIHIYVNKSYAYAVLYDEKGTCIRSTEAARKAVPFHVSILPQIGLIKENEKRLAAETVDKDKETYLSSRHFRNEVYNYQSDYWDEFVELAENTWSGLRINAIEYDVMSDILALYVCDADFYAEIGLMGSGLQMWLQIMWFLARTREDETVILDEPDVYMHPDLQRKLIRLVKRRYPQVIIATHSIEIISELDSKSIITIDKKNRKMHYATDMRAVQKIIDDIGTVSNLALMRLGDARKCLFVEGKDLKIMAKIAEAVFGNQINSLETLPHVSLNGFNNLREAFGTAKLFHDETEGMIRCICILDSDYFPMDMIEEKYAQAQENHLDLHIWKRKELENYLLEPRVLFRLSGQPEEMYETFSQELEALVDTYENRVFDQYAEHILKYKKIDISTANAQARTWMKEMWTSLEGKLALVGGKEFMKCLNGWFKQKFSLNLSVSKIISEFKREEFDSEIVEVIKSLVF